MADQEQIPPKPETHEDADEQGGVFGNLPGKRPALRSPRRADAGGAAGAGAKAAGGQPHSAPPPKPSVPPGGHTPPPGHSPEAEPDAPPAGAQHGGVEDLAWAGVAVAAEAATLGVRLLSRAVEAVRKPPDRG